MNKGSIWFINKDCAPIEEYGTHLRTVKQAQYFQSQGYDVKVVCSAKVHNRNINHLEKGIYKEEIYDGVPFLFVNTLDYEKNGIKRVLAYMLFSWNVYRMKKKLVSPNVVVHTSRIPFDFLVYKFAKSIKAKYIVDITDLWPLEIERFGFLKPDSMILKLLYRIEKKLYVDADHVVFSMEGYQDYLKGKKWDIENGGPIDLKKTHYVNNGINLLEFDEDIKRNRISDKDLEDNSTFKLIYLGSIRQANHLDTLIDAAKELAGQKDIRLIIYGDGPERKPLEKRVQDEHIDNVLFKQQWIELKYVPYVLSKASVNVLNYGAVSAPYGGSMNKMMMSLASGKPIVCNVGMNYSPIRKHSIGIDRVFANSRDYANAILDIYNLPKNDYDAMCDRVKEAAKEFDMPELCKRFAEYCEL